MTSAEVGGRGVGRDDDSSIFATACGAETCWAKSWFEYYLSRGPGSALGDEDEEEEPIPEPPPVLPPPVVRVKRDYFPQERALFEAFGVQPPEYEVTLR